MLSYVERVACQIYSIAFLIKGLISPCRNWYKIRNTALPHGSEILENPAFLRSFTGKETFSQGVFVDSVLSVTSLRLDGCDNSEGMPLQILLEGKRCFLCHLPFRRLVLPRRGDSATALPHFSYSNLLQQGGKTVLNLPHQSLLVSGPPDCCFCCYSPILQNVAKRNAITCNHLKRWSQMLPEPRLQFNRKG